MSDQPDCNVCELSRSSAESPGGEEDKIPHLRFLIDPDAPKAVGHRGGYPRVGRPDETAGLNTVKPDLPEGCNPE